LTCLLWYIDTSHAVHEDCRGHSGSTMTFGRQGLGAVQAGCNKQKINTKSSTESELVGVDEFLPQVLWTRYFLEGQGYQITENIIKQDNRSTILLAKNGRGSSSKRTKHINIRYYFIKDRIDCGEASIEYCPTELMWSDCLTKPLQGKAFRLQRAVIMNCPVDYQEIDGWCTGTVYVDTPTGEPITRPIRKPSSEPTFILESARHAAKPALPKECVEERPKDTVRHPYHRAHAATRVPANAKLTQHVRGTSCPTTWTRILKAQDSSTP